MAVTVTCPACGQRLTVSASAPPWLTCPRCLGKIRNAAGGTGPSPSPAPAPVRVIPVEEQVDRDRTLAEIGMIVLICFLGVGAMLALQTAAMLWPFAATAGQSPLGSMVLIVIFGPIAAAVTMAIVLWYLIRQRRDTIVDKPAAQYEATTAGQFISGCVLAGAGCAGAVIFELGYAQPHAFGLSTPQKVLGWFIVIGALAGLIAWAAWRGRRLGEWGYFAGALTGLALGSLVVSFCGGLFGMVSS
jgi:hypothetical protein